MPDPASSLPAVALRVAGLRKRFGGSVAVDGVSFEVPRGALSTFLGPSGCGKTTTLRMVAGLERPDHGEIAVDGETLADDTGVMVPPERRRIGMVFQSYAVWPHMTVARNVAFPLEAQGVPRATIRPRVAEALRLVRLDALEGRYPGELSGGQQQRVALARAIVFEPRLLLLDEPLSNLDAALREEMRFEIRTLQQRLGMTALFVTHDQDEALAISDIVLIMERGRILQSGRPRDVYERPSSRFVARFVGWRNFLPARVTEGGLTIGGERLGLSAGGSVGTGLDLCLRPEDVTVRPAGEPRHPHELPGTVAMQLYKATHVELEIDVLGHPIVAHAPSAVEYGRGQSVLVGLSPDRLQMFPADGGSV